MSLDFLKNEISNKRKKTEDISGPSKKYLRRGELEKLKEERERQEREKQKTEQQEKERSEAAERERAKVCTRYLLSIFVLTYYLENRPKHLVLRHVHQHRILQPRPEIQSLPPLKQDSIYPTKKLFGDYAKRDNQSVCLVKRIVSADYGYALSN